MLANVYVVVPAGRATFVVPDPKVSVKMGSPEFPVQKPNCAFKLEATKSISMNTTFVRFFLIAVILIEELIFTNDNNQYSYLGIA